MRYYFLEWEREREWGFGLDLDLDLERERELDLEKRDFFGGWSGVVVAIALTGRCRERVWR